MKKILFIVLLLAAHSAYARNGIYFLAETGGVNYSGLPSGATENARIQTPSLPSAFRGSVGYNHDLFPFWGIALEVGMSRFGKETYIYPTQKRYIYSRTLEFIWTSTLHVQQWDTFFKLGGLRQTVILTGADNQTCINPFFAIGAAYNINCHVAPLIEVIHIKGRPMRSFAEFQNKTPDVNAVMLGLRYTF